MTAPPGRCAACPVADLPRCAGQSVRRYCELIAAGGPDVEFWTARVRERSSGARPTLTPGPAPTQPSPPRDPGEIDRFGLLRVLSCDHRLPLDPEDLAACGCGADRAVCLAGQSSRDDGRVSFADCHACPLTRGPAPGIG